MVASRRCRGIRARLEVLLPPTSRNAGAPISPTVVSPRGYRWRGGVLDVDGALYALLGDQPG
jgi:hypothetical protein